jgi:hypothetical protein
VWALTELTLQVQTPTTAFGVWSTMRSTPARQTSKYDGLIESGPFKGGFATTRSRF